MRRLLLKVIISLLSIPLYAQADHPVIKISDDIELIRLSENAYVHVSRSEIAGFGIVSSNGLLLVDKQEAFLFDTPVTNSQTETLVKWVADSLQSKVTTFVPNHWHEDCMGGLQYLHSAGVISYANQMTIDIAREKGLPVPQNGFQKSKTLKLNDKRIICFYPGAAHSMDNIVVWVPSENILFSGCMTKDIHSSGLGNSVDGDINQWSNTIQKVMRKFPNAKIVIPGHGEVGGFDQLEHTYQLAIQAKNN